MSSTTTTKSSSEYDLTHKISKFLDLHMMFPLIEWLSEQNIYDDKELLEAKYAYAQKTKMADFTVGVYKALHNTTEVPKELAGRKAEVMSELKKLRPAVKPLVIVLKNQDMVKKLKEEKKFNLEGLAKHSVTEDTLDAFFQVSRLYFDLGLYKNTTDSLSTYRQLAKLDSDKSFTALWGQLAAYILDKDTDQSLACVNVIREAIGNRNFVKDVNQLEQKTWLVHWALFPFFRSPNAAKLICEFFFTGGYLDIVAINCPWILRYISWAVIMDNCQRHLPTLVNVLKRDEAVYNDPLTGVLLSLFSKYDVESAQEKLRECEIAIRSDYFFFKVHGDVLEGKGEELVKSFLTSSRKMILQLYCVVNQKIDLKELSSTLGMELDATEKWMVALIQSSGTDLENAKIDSNKKHVLMGLEFPSVYDQIVEKINSLSHNTYSLVANMGRVLQKRNQKKY